MQKPAQVFAVQTENRLSEWFRVESGVRQGCLLSPTLFAMLRNFVINTKQSPERQIQDCDFADDIVLVAHCQEDIQHNLNELAAKLSSMGVKINIDKTKNMSKAEVTTIAAGIRYEGTDI